MIYNAGTSNTLFLMRSPSFGTQLHHNTLKYLQTNKNKIPITSFNVKTKFNFGTAKVGDVFKIRPLINLLRNKKKIVEVESQLSSFV